MAFLIFAGFDILNLNSDQVLMFLEFMVTNKSSHFSLCNHVSAIRTKLCFFGLNTSPLEDKRIKYFT